MNQSNGERALGLTRIIYHIIGVVSNAMCVFSCLRSETDTGEDEEEV